MSATHVCTIDESQQGGPVTWEGTLQVVIDVNLPNLGIRTALISSYELSKFFYGEFTVPKTRLGELGALVWYHLGVRQGRNNKRRTAMDVDQVVSDWERVVTGLAIAHDKDAADKYESEIDKCLTPILGAPVKQIREFYPKLLEKLKANPAVPFMVWRSYEIWIECVVSKAADEEVLNLKTELAQEISDLVEQDVRDQIPEQLFRALQWRSSEKLEQVKQEAIKVKQSGGKARLRGRESCLFLELGGTTEQPAVTIQI